MRKNVFYTVMMMVVMAVVAISLTACGGDDGPLTDKTSQDGNETTQDDVLSYVWPCMQWGCTQNDIKKYMGSSMVLKEERDGILIYATPDEKYTIGYAIYENSLYCAYQSTYMGYTQKKLDAIKSKFLKDYGITFKNMGGGVWMATGILNNKNCEIKIYGWEASDLISVDVFIL